MHPIQQKWNCPVDASMRQELQAAREAAAAAAATTTAVSSPGLRHTPTKSSVGMAQPALVIGRHYIN